MIRSTIFSIFLWLQVALLLITGVAILYWSQDLMVCLIHLVGGERALGAENVVIGPGGSKLLTNPGAQTLWTTPFLLLGTMQIVAALTIAWLSWTRPQEQLEQASQ